MIADYWVTVGDAFADWVATDPEWAAVRAALAAHPPDSVGTCALCGRPHQVVRQTDWSTWTETRVLKRDDEESLCEGCWLVKRYGRGLKDGVIQRIDPFGKMPQGAMAYAAVLAKTPEGQVLVQAPWPHTWWTIPHLPRPLVWFIPQSTQKLDIVGALPSGPDPTRVILNWGSQPLIIPTQVLIEAGSIIETLRQDPQAVEIAQAFVATQKVPASFKKPIFAHLFHHLGPYIPGDVLKLWGTPVIRAVASAGTDTPIS